MCVYFLGKRHAGENHNDAVALFKTIKYDKEINSNANNSNYHLDPILSFANQDNTMELR